jgi:hypothetical protein
MNIDSIVNKLKEERRAIDKAITTLEQLRKTDAARKKIELRRRTSQIDGAPKRKKTRPSAEPTHCHARMLVFPASKLRAG